MIKWLKRILRIRRFKPGQVVVCRYDPWNKVDMISYCQFFGQGPSINDVVTVDRYPVKNKNHIILKEYSELFDNYDAGFWDECFETVELDKIDISDAFQHN